MHRLGLPVHAVTSAQFVNTCIHVYTAEVAETDCESPRFVCYKKRYVHRNILHFKPATENVIEKNTSRNLFGFLGVMVSTVFRVFRRVNATALELFLTLNILTLS